MPRPPRADSRLVARHTVSIRLTDEEVEALDQRLRAQNASFRGAGMPPMVTRSVFLRSALLRELVSPDDTGQAPPRIRPTSLGTPTWERLTRRVVTPVPVVVQPPPPVVSEPDDDEEDEDEDEDPPPIRPLDEDDESPRSPMRPWVDTEEYDVLGPPVDNEGYDVILPTVLSEEVRPTPDEETVLDQTSLRELVAPMTQVPVVEAPPATSSAPSEVSDEELTRLLLEDL